MNVALSKKFQSAYRAMFVGQSRDPRYVFTLIIATILFALFTIQAVDGAWFKGIEQPIFHWVNSLPSFLGPVMYIITQFGSLGSLPLWVFFAWKTINRRAAILVTVSCTLGWLLAKVAKVSVHRDRPQGFFDSVNIFQHHIYSGFGFPSGHSTFVAAAVATVYFYSKRRYRKYLLLTAFLVGISRIYLGAHLPLDVLGGWSLGVMSGSIVNLVFGNHKKRPSAARIKRALLAGGLEARHVLASAVDARGSTPITIELAGGKTLFGKLFGEEEHAADWLFKLYRFFRFKNLHSEDPFLNRKRNLELESFAALWARRAKVRTPEIIDLFRIGSHWLLIQEKLTATPLNEYKQVRTTALEDCWQQVKLLHNANIAHRDLRAANIMIDRAGKAWLIDFGFAEVAASKRRKNIDVAELLMSMSLLAGVKRTVAAASRHMRDEQLKAAYPYLQTSVFSGATTSALKQDKAKLKELQQALQQQLHIDEDTKQADIDRLNGRKLINIGILGVFFYIIIPQFNEFTGFLQAIKHAQWEFVPLAIIASLGTYVAAAMCYVALANVPLGAVRATLVQVASSFMSKLLPGGIGGTALIARFLVRSGMSSAEASSTIAVQNIVSIVSFIVPLGLLLIVTGQSFFSASDVHVSGFLVIGAGAALLIGVALLIKSKDLRDKIKSFLTDTYASLKDISNSPKELALAFGFAFGVTLFYIGAVYFSMLSFGLSLTIVDACIVYAIATIAKTAVPTPGGLGAVEVGMATAMAGMGVAGPTAYAVVILYRLVTFWLPIPFSYAAYRYIDAKRYI